MAFTGRNRKMVASGAGSNFLPQWDTMVFSTANGREHLPRATGSLGLVVLFANAILSLAAAAAIAAPLFAQEAQGEAEASPEELRRYVQMLGAPSYQSRQVAMRRLQRLGPSAIEVLEGGIASGNLEIVDRASQLLQGMATVATPNETEPAWDALQRVRQYGPGSASLRALSAIEEIKEQRVERAEARLAAAALNVGYQELLVGLQSQANEVANMILFPPRWEEDEEALRWFPWMYRTTAVSLQGPTVSDQVFEAIAKLPQLRVLQIRDTVLSAEGIRKLATVPRLEVLDLAFVEFGKGEGDLEALAALPLRGQLILLGTDFEAEDVEELRERLKNLEITFSRGGFLGVLCDQLVAECLIRSCQADSAAERAGLRSGDVIIQIGKEPVRRFTDLQQEVRKYRPGTKVVVKVRRGIEEIDFDVELGRFSSGS